MNESAKNTEKPMKPAPMTAICCAMNVVRGTAVSYDIQSSGNSLIDASVCRPPTADAPRSPPAARAPSAAAS